MVDPYEDDDSVDGFTRSHLSTITTRTPTDDHKKVPLMRAFQQVGQTIRTSGFCSPKASINHKKKPMCMHDTSDAPLGAIRAKLGPCIQGDIPSTTNSNTSVKLLIAEEQDENPSQNCDLDNLDRATFKSKRTPITSILILFSFIVLASSLCRLVAGCTTPIGIGMLSWDHSQIFSWFVFIIFLILLTPLIGCSDATVVGAINIFWNMSVIGLVMLGVYYTFDTRDG